MTVALSAAQRAPSPEPDAAGASKVGSIYTSVENPGRNLALWMPADLAEYPAVRGSDYGSETMGIIKYSA